MRNSYLFSHVISRVRNRGVINVACRIFLGKPISYLLFMKVNCKVQCGVHGQTYSLFAVSVTFLNYTRCHTTSIVINTNIYNK